MASAPDIEPPEAHWRAALADGCFLLQRDAASGAAVFPPRLALPGEKLEWIQASGEGTVHSLTEIAQRPPADPYNVVLVDLAEGPRMMATVTGAAPGELRIGMAVRASIADSDDGPRVVFHPA